MTRSSMLRALLMWMATGSLVGGCYVDLGGPGDPGAESWGDWEDAEPADTFVGEGTEPLTIRDSSLEGGMGPVDVVPGRVWQEQAEGWNGWSVVSIHARDRGERWAGMAMFHVNGGLNHPRLRPGAVLTFREGQLHSATVDPDEVGVEAPEEDPLAEPWVDTVGCSGPSDPQWDWDETAEEMTLHVLQGAEPHTRRYEFVAHFAGSWAPVRGAFEVEVPGEVSSTHP